MPIYKNTPKSKARIDKLNVDNTTKVTTSENEFGLRIADPKYICNKCGELLAKVDEDIYHCDNCRIITIPTIEDVRTMQDIEVPRGPAEETLISHVLAPHEGDMTIKHELELKSGFKALASKGNIRFTSYSEYNP
jgi:hypothetical protein